MSEKLPPEVETLTRERDEARAHISAGIVSLCVCENAASPRPDCPCVTCTVARAEAREREALTREMVARAERDEAQAKLAALTEPPK